MPRVPVPSPSGAAAVVRGVVSSAGKLAKGLLRPLGKMVLASAIAQTTLLYRFRKAVVLGGAIFAIKLLFDEALRGDRQAQQIMDPVVRRGVFATTLGQLGASLAEDAFVQLLGPRALQAPAAADAEAVVALLAPPAGPEAGIVMPPMWARDP